MKKSSLLLIALSIALFISFLSFVPAAVIMVSPYNGSNNTGSITFNCSYVNATDITSPTNVTFLYNKTTNPWTAIQNIDRRHSNSSNAMWATISTSSLTSGYWNVTCALYNGTTNANASVPSTRVLFNNLPSNVTIVNPTNGGNYSGTLIINVTLLNSLVTTTDVYFNITNSTGAQNATVFASKQGSSNNWNATIATTGFADGFYNITVYANDSMNQLNTSVVFKNVIIDNSAPSLSMSCTPNSVSTGDTVTCSCTGSDSLSGIDSSSYSFTVHPSTSQTGTFTATCSGLNKAGVTGSTTSSYTVEGSYSPSSGSQATVTWTATYAAPATELESGYSKPIGTKERVSVSVSGSAHYVGVIALTATSATINVSSKPQQAVFNIGDQKKFDVNEDNFYDLDIKLNSISGTKANFTIKSINEAIPSASPSSQDSTEESPANSNSGVQEKKSVFSSIWFWIILIIIIVAAVIIFMQLRNKY